MPQQLIKALDAALAATMTREELNRFTRQELGRRHNFADNVAPGAYPNQRAEYIAYLERRGKLDEFIEIFLEDMNDNQRSEIVDLHKAVNETAQKPPEPEPTPPPVSETIKKQIHNLIANNRVTKALEVLEAAAVDNPDLYGKVITLKGQQRNLENDEMMNMITFQEAGVRRAQIVKATLGLLR